MPNPRPDYPFTADTQRRSGSSQEEGANTMTARLTSMARFVPAALVVAAWLGVFPVSASAQSAIAGVARDTTGAVLPGVTVEGTSPALIERARTAVTDAAGQYRIVDLRSGTYTVTFTLLGFASVKRE